MNLIKSKVKFIDNEPHNEHSHIAHSNFFAWLLEGAFSNNLEHATKFMGTAVIQRQEGVCTYTNRENEVWQQATLNANNAGRSILFLPWRRTPGLFNHGNKLLKVVPVKLATLTCHLNLLPPLVPPFPYLVPPFLKLLPSPPDLPESSEAWCAVLFLHLISPYLSLPRKLVEDILLISLTCLATVRSDL